MMKKILFAAFAISFIFAVFLIPCNAVDSRAIEAIRGKKVLDSSDLKAIDDFVAQAVSEILNATDFSSISNIRSLLIANSSSSESGQVQFDEQFSQSAKTHISAALTKADSFDSLRRFRVITNLLMVIDDLADPRLVDLPLKYAGDKNVVISYWAVHCVTNPVIVNKFNSGKDGDAAGKAARKLDEIIPTASPDTLGLIATFAGTAKTAQGQELLFKVADKRIASYADWSVRNENIDASILQMLADKMETSNSAKAAAGTRFGQLYSYVIQRYIKGDKVLNRRQKEQLVSVIVETEQKSISKLLKKQSVGIKRAIENNDLNALANEQNNLLGDTTHQGILPTEIGFDYGKDKSGNALTHPLELSLPPSL